MCPEEKPEGTTGTPSVWLRRIDPVRTAYSAKHLRERHSR